MLKVTTFTFLCGKTQTDSKTTHIVKEIRNLSFNFSIVLYTKNVYKLPVNYCNIPETEPTSYLVLFLPTKTFLKFLNIPKHF